MLSQCASEQLFFSAWGGGGGGCRGGVIGRDPCGLAMRRTEAALSPGWLLVRL